MRSKDEWGVIPEEMILGVLWLVSEGMVSAYMPFRLERVLCSVWNIATSRGASLSRRDSGEDRMLERADEGLLGIS